MKMKAIALVSSMVLSGLLFGESVARTDELGQWKDSGVESGFWDVSGRAVASVERSAAVSATEETYETRWYTEAVDTISTLCRDFAGLFMIFR